MKHVRKSVLVPYTPAQMYALVTDVQAYPQFLPWCARGEVLERRDDGTTARLHLAFRGLRHSFTTRNTEVPDRSLALDLIDGPFSMLSGRWDFLPVGDPPRACRIEFDMRYSFANRALDLLVSPVFDRIAETFVDAFVKRAEQVHGAVS